MTDIIERLEAACQKGREDIEPWQCDPFLFGEAAAEIKRLQADMAGDQQRLFHCEGEIERLTAAAARRDEADRMRAKLADDREAGHLAEIERLTDELQDCQSRAITALHELHADNERLRAALGFYANIETYRGHGMQDAEIIHDGGQIARRALEKKP